MAIQTDSVASWVFANRLLAVGALGESDGEWGTRPFVGAGIGGSGGLTGRATARTRSNGRLFEGTERRQWREGTRYGRGRGSSGDGGWKQSS